MKGFRRVEREEAKDIYDNEIISCVTCIHHATQRRIGIEVVLKSFNHIEYFVGVSRVVIKEFS